MYKNHQVVVPVVFVKISGILIAMNETIVSPQKSLGVP